MVRRRYATFFVMRSVSMQFEWDEDKRQSNLAKHEIDFLDAR